MGDTANDLLSSVQNWWKQPFNANGSVGTWFLFLGLVIVITFAWSMILRFILEGTNNA
jgi:hypothetical protein